MKTITLMALVASAAAIRINNNDKPVQVEKKDPAKDLITIAQDEYEKKVNATQKAAQANATINATANATSHASVKSHDSNSTNSTPAASLRVEEVNETAPVPWDPATLPPCPSPERTMMDDGETHVVKYPYVGATCVMQMSAPNTQALVGKKAPAWAGVEHCPDFNERRTLTDGKTVAVAYPKDGWNCHNEGPL